MFPRERSVGYNYAHLALPILVLGNPKGFYHEVSGTRGEGYLKTMWGGLAGRMGVGQSPQGLELSKRVLRDDTEAFLIRLPRPTEPPEAFLVSAVFRVKRQFLGKEVESVRYFTLELGRNVFDQSDEYFLCEWVGSMLSGGEHVNHGQIPDPNEVAFIAAINEVL